MKIRAFTKRITAACAAGILSFSAVPAAENPARAAQAAGSVSAVNAKSPADFESAMEFRNTYGAFRINTFDYKVWLVFEEPLDTGDTPRFQVQPAGDLKEVSHEIYRTPEDSEFGSPYQYEVVYYHHMPNCRTSVSLIDTSLPEGEQTVETYHFRSSPSGSITSDDLYAWVPDSPAEFESYIEKNGAVSVHENYMVFCMTDTAGTAYQWEEGTGENVNQENVQKVLSGSFARRQIPEPIGGAVFRVAVYEAVQDGDVQIEWEKRAFDSAEPPLETCSGAFQIVNGAKQILSPTDAWIELIDADSGERVNLASYPEYAFCVTTDVGYYDERFLESGGDGWIYTGPVFNLTDNPCIFFGFASFFHADKFSFELSTPQAYQVLNDQTEITHFDNGSAAIRFTLKYLVQGDVNDDHVLTPLDAHLLSRWLRGEERITLQNWNAADFDANGVLNAADLTIMKRQIMESRKQLPACTMNVKTTYGGYGVDGHDLGSGSFENPYTVQSGDIFYEDEYGHLMKNALLFQSNDEIPVLKIVDVNDQYVRIMGGFPHNLREIDVPYDEAKQELVFSIHLVSDGINFSYELTFTDYSEPQ
ncbi:MAG: dockerin type I repeat-containing protein [Oscillospiraceae bacterium]|nr:dockerin type I repeat-containing protein [Oscillospiraceae bacterium]